MAHDAAECHRGDAGPRRPRHGRALCRLHRQCGHRRLVADLPGGAGLHRVALHRDGRAGGALCRAQPAAGVEPGRLSGVPDRRDPVHGCSRAARVFPRAVAPGPGQRGARGAGRGAAVWPDPGLRDAWRGHGDGDRRRDRDARGGVLAGARPVGDSGAARRPVAAGSGDHPAALSFRTAHRNSGCGHERRGRDPPSLHRIAAGQRRGPGGGTRSRTPNSSRS